jgi:GNAT superfamily N-acetyltransferase
MNTFIIEKITKRDIAQVAELFNLYRVFYKQNSDLERAFSFIQSRFDRQDSTILIAKRDERVLGFTQLYPSFSSVSTAPILVLNDLFVSEEYRRHGVALALMNAAKEYGRTSGALRLVLSTHKLNSAAQNLYSKLGYTLDDSFSTYELEIGV